MNRTVSRLLAITGMIFTIPLALVLGAYLADWFYVRFQFVGEIKDFAPGDAIGVMLDAVVFAVVILALAGVGWVKLYRRIAK